jgi:hypothetical protein
MSYKYKNAITVSCICLATLFGFQNCGPATGVGASSNSAQDVEELLPYGKLNSEEDLSHFSQKFYGSGGPLPSHVLSQEAGHDGGKGLRLDNTVFQTVAEIGLDKNKKYLISFWARKLTGSKSIPSLLVQSGIGQNPYAPEDNFKPLAQMKVESHDWKKVETVIKPTGPNLYLEFWIMEGDGKAVDMDQISVKEI